MAQAAFQPEDSARDTVALTNSLDLITRVRSHAILFQAIVSKLFGLLSELETPLANGEIVVDPAAMSAWNARHQNCSAYAVEFQAGIGSLRSATPSEADSFLRKAELMTFEMDSLCDELGRIAGNTGVRPC
jgi:hypothetical protein